MKNLEKQAIGIVAQLFDLAEVPVDKRQQINDVAYDYVTEQLIITNVSQQREPLFAYHKHLDSFNDPTIYNASESMIDDYLANNCG